MSLNAAVVAAQNDYLVGANRPRQVNVDYLAVINNSTIFLVKGSLSYSSTTTNL